MTGAELRAMIARYGVRAQAIGLSLLVVVVSVVLGLGARRQLTPARVTEARLHRAADEITSFRAAFKPSTAEQDARLVLPDSLAMAVPHDLRMSLAGQLATRAEHAGLANVRVRFAAADSAAAPTTPDFFGRSVTIGDYTVAIDCDGAFAGVISFVNHLPAPTALERMTAARTPSGVSYHLVFAVFEGDTPGGPGAGGQHD